MMQTTVHLLFLLSAHLISVSSITPNKCQNADIIHQRTTLSIHEHNFKFTVYMYDPASLVSHRCEYLHVAAVALEIEQDKRLH